MHDRTPWTKGRSGDFQLTTRAGKAKTYKNLTEFTRQCATCDKPFAIYVTSKIAASHADSNSFGLKNCEEHRRNLVVRTDTVTDETLRNANNVMKQELAGLYARNQELFGELQQAKARLAKYELQPAMEAVANGEARLTYPWETT